ncbi:MULTISPECIES: CRISPR-associated endonuclease Cas2 [Thermodesulfobacterium]|jgi:CRISPR-associated protein Cas2|uniref:CRISPR-associated endoribonuclease Cas2 n=2 Tax=Thermodesulfobacterium TaxID=1740 RepID=A0A075X0S8_9BACT|nr:MULTISPECIES: CRISPR-associated endonuclease Cas2 [Thermodesulfobacterium]AIH04577.1 CRISPR-associated protein Cas2 [Thermodesulfobacterium commune DSM 2178]
MYVILVYDINEKRVQKVLKICRKFLHWVQNSVFEGEITEAKLFKLKQQLNHVIDPEEDSVVIYTFLTEKYSRREILGKNKAVTDVII